MSKHLGVFFRGRDVGALYRQPTGSLAFEYATSWLEAPDGFPISLSLPLDSGINTSLAAHAFFANLLPEGAVREAVANQLGLSSSNDFALLEAIGGECAGALTILPPHTGPDTSSETYEPLEMDAIAEMARRHSVLAEMTGRRPRLSLAGAQDKLPVRLHEDGSLSLPMGGAPSTHILKVPARDFKYLPVNEVLIIHLAQEFSLQVVDIELIEIEDIQIALVARYDRIESDDGIERIHQEDLCQALGLMPDTKYEQEGGPSFADAIDTLRAHTLHPLTDVQQLLRWLVFNLLAGNSDGHAKNLSFLHTSTDKLRLAPFYDLVCTRAYPRVDRHLAMAIGGERDPGQIRRQHWEQLAIEIGIGERLIIALVEEWTTSIVDIFDRIAADFEQRHGESPIVQQIRPVIYTQARRTRHLLNHDS